VASFRGCGQSRGGDTLDYPAAEEETVVVNSFQSGTTGLN